jgi:hypothetical protein
MVPNPKLETERVEPESKIPSASGVGRRRLLRAGLAATPVVLAVSGRSAMATATCATGLSPMAWNSVAPNGICIGTSHTVQGNPLGKSPGFWKPNPNGQTFQGAWPPTAVPFVQIDTISNKTLSKKTGPTQTLTWDSSNWAAYKDIAWAATGWATGTKFNSKFTNLTDSRSFTRILIDDNGTLNWHLSAAFLNVATYGAAYALTFPELLDLAGGKLGSKTGVPQADIIAFLKQTWV